MLSQSTPSGTDGWRRTTSRWSIPQVGTMQPSAQETRDKTEAPFTLLPAEHVAPLRTPKGRDKPLWMTDDDMTPVSVTTWRSCNNLAVWHVPKSCPGASGSWARSVMLGIVTNPTVRGRIFASACAVRLFGVPPT